ncbi:MAG TPA: IS1595 family transposase [Candidatus Binataceae bacterium]|nr:IS1595 family transposase [Candidatus Binataceae bacterium]
MAEAKSGIVAALPRACSDETAAVEFLEAQRWAVTGPCCPHCGGVQVYQMKDRTTGERNKRFLWLCRDCGKQYTARTGTVFEDSRIPLRHWCYGFWAAAASKKGISSQQIQRMTGLSYKSALFMMHRIRFAMANDFEPKPKLSGIVEADETYVGGREKNKPLSQRNAKNLGGKGKVPVFAMVQRGGDVRSIVMDKVTMANLRKALLGNVDLSTRIMTDSFNLYGFVGKPFARHDFVNHNAEEYVRGDVTTNTVEGVFSLLKRGLYGTFHSVSKKHLHRYLAEFDFRYNTRKFDDGERAGRLIRNANGKRLTYAEQIGKTAEAQSA